MGTLATDSGANHQRRSTMDTWDRLWLWPLLYSTTDGSLQSLWHITTLRYGSRDYSPNTDLGSESSPTYIFISLAHDWRYWVGLTRSSISPNEAFVWTIQSCPPLRHFAPLCWNVAVMKTYIQDVCDVQAQSAVSSVKPHHSSPALEHALELVAKVWKE